MLVRAYRVTDKLGIVLLKSIAGVGAWCVDGANIVVQFVQRGGGGVFALIFVALLAIFRIIKRIVLVIWGILSRIFGMIFSRIGIAGRSAGRTSAGGAQSARAGAAGNIMARRAARAELETNLAEDPLRTQNRFLSGVVVVVLAALVVAVIIATSGGRDNTPSSGVPAVVDLNLGNAGSATPTVAQGGLLPTPVPTATDIPELLQARGSLAFVVHERGQDDIWMTSIDSRNPLRITSSPEDDRDPSFSPDGQRLAYASHRDGNWDIYILNMNNPLGEPERKTFGIAFDARPVWSSDGVYLAYESYQNNNLDILIMSVDGTVPPQALPSMSGSAEFSPAWSPEGRQIAYVSWRDGNQDIYVVDLNDGEAFNLTNSPTRHEDYPAWNPDGTLLAYSAVDEGIEKVFVKSVSNPEEPAQVIARGRNPSWSPDGNSIIFAVDSFEGTQFIVEPYEAGGITTPVISVALPSDDPVWTDAPLSPAFLNSGGASLGVTDDLFVEQVTPLSGDRSFGLQNIGVDGPELPVLSDAVDDSFNALRERVNNAVGSDFLGTLESALWDLDYRPNPNEPNRNWHRTGRAFSFNRNLLLSFPAPVEVVREDTDLETDWRVFVRVDEDAQSGELGEPLRRMPWQFVSSSDGDVEAYDQGGRLQTTIPAGYYVDLTQIAEDYGWERQPAGTDWRANVFTRNYWMFVKKDGLSWYEAMRQIYTFDELGGFNPTATPIPPDTNTNNSDSGNG